MNHIYFPYNNTLKRLNISERNVALQSGISRSTFRKASTNSHNMNISALISIAEATGSSLDIILSPRSSSEFSIVAISAAIVRDGFESWKIHLMDFVDEFRRCPDPRLIILEPLRALDKKLTGLLASTTRLLCNEVGIPTPDWANKTYFIDKPWFPSNIESLKAFAILESPVEFRANNIFVLENFLDRR